MNFYPFHLGDYAAHTRHLTLLEDLAYRRMLDLYYTSEAPLPIEPEKVARLIGMRDHMQEVSDVLSDFFVKSEDGYTSARCDKEIKAYKAKAERAKQANLARWGGDKSDADLNSDSTSDADQIPTNNQEPVTSTKTKAKSKAEAAPAARLPADWLPSYDDARFCETARPDLKIDEVAACFRDYWIAQPGAKGRKTDWPATWRNWVRNQKSAPQARGSPGYQTANDKAKAWADRLTGKNRNDQPPDPDIIDINPAPYKLG